MTPGAAGAGAGDAGAGDAGAGAGGVAGFDAVFPGGPPPVLGVAVSGGGDSVALLDLAQGWAAARGVALRAVTVDHGLRDGSAAEAAAVARACAARGVGHDILRWQGWDGAGNLLAAARAARFRLIGGWARGAGIGAVALGHTRDDVAETLLMRLARAAGVDGLAAMPARFSRDGVVWVRPLLGVGRAALRDHLVARGIGWVEDPSNADDRFARTRARAVLAALAPLGLDAAVLATVAGNLAGAAEALRAQAARDAPRLVRADRGDLLLERSPEPAVPDEIARRVLVGALRAVAGGAWPPRRAALAALEAGMAGPGRHTLAGCVVSRRGTLWRIAREWAAVQGVEGPTDAPWDGRWWLAGPHEPGLTVRALGPDGLAQCPGWRAGGLPRASLLASPAVWRGAVLVAAPLAGRPGGWRAECRARLFCD